jgi:hypothetical protein
MAEVFRRASLREGSTISFMAKAGLRPEVLGKVQEMLVKAGVGKTSNQASA